MPRKGRQVIIARGIARSTISGSRKTTTRESPPPPPSLAFSSVLLLFLPFPPSNREYITSRRDEDWNFRANFEFFQGRKNRREGSKLLHTHTYTHGCAKRGSRYMPRPSTYSGGFRFSGRCTRVHPVRYQRGWGRGKDGEGGRARGASRTRDA